MILTDFDDSKFFLGKLCRNKHSWNNSDVSLRYITSRRCKQCVKNTNTHCQANYYKENKAYKQEYRRKNRETILIKQREYYENNKEKARQYKCEYREKNKEKISLKGAVYYQNNRDEIKKKACDYYGKNLEECQERHRQYKKLNREKLLQANRENYQKNREQYLKRAAIYRSLNPEKRRLDRIKWKETPRGRELVRANNRKRKTLKLTNHYAPYTPEQLSIHQDKFDNCCGYCGSVDKLTLDHFIPISKGGPEAIGNLVPCCSPCNSSKFNYAAKDWYEKQSFYKRDRWLKILKLLGKTDATYSQLPLF